MILEKRLDDDSVIFKMPDGKKARYVNDKVIDDIRSEIAENQNVVSGVMSFDEFYNGKWAGFELALAIIDKHIKVERHKGRK